MASKLFTMLKVLFGSIKLKFIDARIQDIEDLKRRVVRRVIKTRRVRNDNIVIIITNNSPYLTYSLYRPQQQPTIYHSVFKRFRHQQLMIVSN